MSAYENKGPSLLGVTFFAIQIAMIGCLAGFILLASIPPKPFNSATAYENYLEEHPDELRLNAHYFRGSTSPTRDWKLKREVLLVGKDTSLELSNAEINSWLLDKFKLPAKSFPEAKEPKFYLVPELPNFFADPVEGINFSMPLEIVFFGRRIDCLLIGQGQFTGKGPVKFQLSNLRMNEARIPFSDKIQALLLSSLFKPFYQNEEFTVLKEAWVKVDSVEIIENGIRLNLN